MKRKVIEVFYNRMETMGYEFARRITVDIGSIESSPPDVIIHVATRLRGPKTKERVVEPNFTMAEWQQINRRIKLEIDGLIEKTLDVDHNKEGA